ncbi:MAG: T9SS type A sorting domain-containing protein [Flavobacterium sp.]|uniref:T9SS type A sorting domain-containing protein n=1 Tax=Flavobacterium sp. TaxID=239 RepID=UPI0032670F96
MKSTFKFCLLSILFSQILFSQENKTIYESTVWIKNNTDYSKNESSQNNLFFNFNKVIPFSSGIITKKIKNCSINEMSLFLVYKSSNEEEQNLIQLQKGKNKTFISSKRIINQDEILLNKGDVKKGYILSYLNTDNSIISSKKQNLLFEDDLYNDKEGKNILSELIYIPRNVNQYERNLIESYLSIKYGISLTEKNYYSSKGEKIWNLKKNSSFGNRITGIGRDNYFELNQKQSGNSENDGIYIAFNSLKKSNNENLSDISNNTYVLWGDNGKKNKIEDSKTSVNLNMMERIWKVQTTSESNKIMPTQIFIDKNLMPLENTTKPKTNQKVWLVVDSNSSDKIDFSVSTFYPATINDDEKVVFDKVEWKANSTSLFTLIKATDFFVISKSSAISCNSNSDGKIDLKIVGGLAPYKIKIQSNKLDKEIISNDNDVVLNNLESGDYIITVSDSKNVFKSEIKLDPFSQNEVKIASQYFMDENTPIEITPTVEKPEQIETYKWYSNNVLLSTDATIKVDKIGNYKLVVFDKKGCSKEMPFDVIESSKKEGWTLFPNPVDSGQNFQIHFNLKQFSNVSIMIHDINGKLIKNLNLNSIKDNVVTESIQTSGTFLVSVTIDGKTQTSKLIIK